LLAALKSPNENEPWVGTRIEGLAAKIAAGQTQDNILARASCVSAALVNTLQALKQRRHAAGTLLRFGFARLRIHARQAIRAEERAVMSVTASQNSIEYTPTAPTQGRHRADSNGQLRRGLPGRTLTIGSGPHAPRSSPEDSPSSIAGLGPSTENMESARRSAAGASCKWRAGLKPNSQRSALQFAQKADAFIGAVAWSYTGSKPTEPSLPRSNRKLRSSSKYAGADGDGPADEESSSAAAQGEESRRDGRKGKIPKALPTPDPTANIATPVFDT